MTVRLKEALAALGLSTSGSLGTRLSARLGIVTSWMTILRRIMELPEAPAVAVTAASHRRFFVQARTNIWHDPGGSERAPGARPAGRANHRECGSVDARASVRPLCEPGSGPGLCNSLSGRCPASPSHRGSLSCYEKLRRGHRTRSLALLPTPSPDPQSAFCSRLADVW